MGLIKQSESQRGLFDVFLSCWICCRLAGTKALKDAGISYKDVEQACVGYCFGTYRKFQGVCVFVSHLKLWLNWTRIWSHCRRFYLWSTSVVSAWYDWNPHLQRKLLHLCFWFRLLWLTTLEFIIYKKHFCKLGIHWFPLSEVFVTKSSVAEQHQPVTFRWTTIVLLDRQLFSWRSSLSKEVNIKEKTFIGSNCAPARWSQPKGFYAKSPNSLLPPQFNTASPDPRTLPPCLGAKNELTRGANKRNTISLKLIS